MTKALDCAFRLLARREHGAVELVEKLIHKGYDKNEAVAVLSECQRLALQSDLRFAQQLCRARINQGYGPVRIRQELQSKQVSSDVIEDVLATEKDNWLSHARVVWQKKFKPSSELSFTELQKQRRFLLYRGFPNDIIASVFE
ncbi:recombination regulator RecX [Legionella spiritensis]|uniref:recombination regulator RecX n=1 Tax=Legionella spiritensis TaxID=452 RepID=UPI000F6FFC64|nr:recombination regulator RecX [Legionella spiritensis]VEG90590.1 regulatory protein RecX [Legionella spiritensis]